MKEPLAVLFANLKGNIGDFAILHAILIDLEAAYSGHPVHVYAHGFHPVDGARTGALRSFAPPFELTGTTFTEKRRPHRHLARFAKLCRLGPDFQSRRIKSLARQATASAERLARYHRVFLAGGAHWTGADAGVSMFGTLRAVWAHNDRIFAYPFSINPSIRYVNRKAALKADFSLIRPPLVVRDSRSKRDLGLLGVDAVLGADCVFLLESLAAEIEAAPGRDSDRILLIVTGQERVSLEQTVRKLSGRPGSLALLTTCAPEDSKTFEAVSQACGVPFLAPLTWQETVAEMKASALVITNRLHGLILGSFAETPIVPLVDRPKTLAVANDAGLVSRVERLADIGPDTVDRFLNRRNDILGEVSTYRATTRARPRGPIEIFRNAPAHH